MKFFLIVSLRAYQLFIAPLFPVSCRFQPTCSNYAIGVLQKYGALKGSNKAVRRLLRCHPFSGKHGWDPV